jgi:nucleoid-associated protein YgaU
MGLLDALLGGGQGREEQQDFLQRFEQGQPWEGYSDQEVLKRYGTVAGQASRQEYEQAAAEAFGRLSPDQRVEFGRLLQQRARERQVNLGDLEHSGINDFQDARRLAQLTGGVHEQPGLLRSILGGGEGKGTGQQQAGLLGSPLAKAALAGIAAMAIKKVLGARASSAGTATGPTTSGTAGWSPGTIPSPPASQETPRTMARDTTTAAPSAGAAAERWHQVVSGDTLSKLAAKFYGDGRQYMKIFEANRDVLTDPDKIRIGQRLRIP